MGLALVHIGTHCVQQKYSLQLLVPAILSFVLRSARTMTDNVATLIGRSGASPTGYLYRGFVQDCKAWTTRATARPQINGALVGLL